MLKMFFFTALTKSVFYYHRRLSETRIGFVFKSFQYILLFITNNSQVIGTTRI